MKTKQIKTLLTALLLSRFAIAGGWSKAQAQSAATPPAELVEVVSAIETAANNKDLQELLEYYSDDFTNTDGLSTDSLAKALQQMWKSYPRLKYSTQIISWSEADDQLVAETITTIRGVNNNQGRIARLNSTIKSRQYFQDQQLVNQEILAEQSKLTSGDNPPQVKVVAPETVNTGERYNFDLIVDEPLGDKVLLGAIKEEKTASNLYLNPTALELEPLPAGGIYKTATAALLPDSNWVSAIVVRGDGITMVSHRIEVKAKPEANNREKQK